MSSMNKDAEEPSSSSAGACNSGGNGAAGMTGAQRPPAKRRFSNAAVIEILDTESDDSDVCAVNSYQASADEVKRIRGDYSSSSSSSSDYSSDSESSWEDDSVVIPDKLDIRFQKAELNPRANRMDDPLFNPLLQSQELLETLSSHWKEFKDFESEEVTLTAEPFRLCLLHNLLANPEIINNIVDDMNTLDWTRKKMDLYEFHQTTDLANLSWQRSIRCIYQLLKTEVMKWVSQLMGLSLTHASASCSLYGPGDHLLLHDDLMADRRVAFVLYLAPWAPRSPTPTPTPAAPEPRDPCALAVPRHNGAADKLPYNPKERQARGWTRSMGGALELFERDACGRPTDVARRVLPRNNMLALFRVGHESFHQVSEVLTLELPRLTINGWFHGPEPAEPPEPPPPPPLDEPPAELRPHNKVVVLSSWLASTYMCPRVRAQVQAQMERASEVLLRDVLLPQRLRQLMDALRGEDVEWERCAAGQQRRYERVAARWLEAEGPEGAAGEDGAESEEHPVRALLQLVSSTAFLRMLTDCTDVPLSTYSHLELQRWHPGDFTLIPPREHYLSPRLEAMIYLGVPDHVISGGQTIYVAPEGEGEGGRGGAGEDEALITLPPRHNALSLVYCDAGAASFTKYLSKLTLPQGQHFFILTCSYCE